MTSIELIDILFFSIEIVVLLSLPIELSMDQVRFDLSLPMELLMDQVRIDLSLCMELSMDQVRIEF